MDIFLYVFAVSVYAYDRMKYFLVLFFLDPTAFRMKLKYT